VKLALEGDMKVILVPFLKSYPHTTSIPVM